MDTIDQPNWYRVSVTGLTHDEKHHLISNGWIQSNKYPSRGLFMKGTGASGTKNLTYDEAIGMHFTAATNTDVS